MQRKKIHKLFAGLMAAALVVGSSLPVLADEEPVEEPGYEVAGTTSTFNKFLILDAGDTVPNVTFSFTAAAGEAVEWTDETMAVYAGIGTPTIEDVTFSPEDATSTSAGSYIDVARDQEDRTGTAGQDTVQLDEGEKFAVKQATVDFSDITFTEPGIYRYIITETTNESHAAAGIIHDTDVDRVLDVYIMDEDGTLAVAGYVLHTEATAPALSEQMGSGNLTQSDKTDGFTNEYTSRDLKIGKEVSGNQASRNKYFALTVVCTNVAEEDSFVVSLADDGDASTNDGDAEAVSGTNSATIEANAGKTNPETLTGSDLLEGQTFYLRHGQSVVIRGLAPNVAYKVTENSEDYLSESMTGATNDGTIGEVAGEGKMANAGFTNTRNGVVPTGVAVAMGTGLAVIGIALLGIFATRKKSREEK